MKARKRVLAALIAATMVAGSLTACGKKSDDKKADEKVLNISTGSIVVGLNPILNTSGPDNTAHNMVQEPLVLDRALENNGHLVGEAAAESWDVSEDGKTYTFHMRKEAKWSDGEPVTAKDFEYTLKLMADPNVGATNGWLYDGMIEGFTEALYEGADPQSVGVTATDDYTLEIKILHPAMYFPNLLCNLFPVRQDKYEEWGTEYGSSPDKTIYSGAFTVESWNQNTEMVLVKNENYWNADKVGIDKMNYKVIQDEATAIQAFINDELDIIYTKDANWGKQIEAEGDSTKQDVQEYGSEFFLFNAGNEYLKNPKIRLALSLAYDREEMIETINEGKGEVRYTMIPDYSLIGDKSYTELVNGENNIIEQLAKENPDPKKLFQEGLKELGKDTDTSKVTLTYVGRGTTEKTKKIAEWIKQQWETNLGITLDIELQESNIMWQRVEAADYDIAQCGWGPYYNEPSGLLSIFTESAFFNPSKTNWTDARAEEFTALLDSAKEMTDQQELADTYLEAEKILLGDAIVSTQMVGLETAYVKNRVKGFYICTTGQTDWADVTIVEE